MVGQKKEESGDRALRCLPQRLSTGEKNSCLAPFSSLSERPEGVRMYSGKQWDHSRDNDLKGGYNYLSTGSIRLDLGRLIGLITRETFAEILTAKQ